MLCNSSFSPLQKNSAGTQRAFLGFCALTERDIYTQLLLQILYATSSKAPYMQRKNLMLSQNCCSSSE